MLEAFATTQDLEAGWRLLETDEMGIAEELLARAATTIRAAMRNAGVEIVPDDEVQEASLKDVSCSMVRRQLSFDDEMIGVRQFSEAADGFTQSATFAYSDGTMRLSSAEMEQLGIGIGDGVAFIRPVVGGAP